jgi:2-dehydropantoate 2-reductase
LLALLFACGVVLPGDPVARVMQVAQATAANRSSMLQDMERGRRTEVDAINGAVAERGLRLGVPTPVNQTLTELVLALS